MNQSTPKTKAATPHRRRPTGGTTYYQRNQEVFVPDGYLAIGRVTTAHSLHGEMRVELYTDFPERFAPGTAVFVGTELHKTVVEAARPHKNSLLIKLAGVDDRTQAEALRAVWLFIAEDQAVPLEADTYWVHEIIGMTVITESGDVLGTITDVIFTGANEVYVVEQPTNEDKKKELLLPAIADVVRTVDVAQKRMVVHLLPGLGE